MKFFFARRDGRAASRALRRMTLRISYSLTTLCFLSALCACKPDSNNIGETLSTGEQSGSTTGAVTETTGAVTDGETTLGETTTVEGTTSGTGTTTTETTAETTTGTASTGDASTGDASTETGGATFPCGMMACDVDTQYCSVLIPGIMGAETMYSCVQIPGRCADAPSCACLNDEQGPCQCAEDQGFTVTCAAP